MRVPVIGAVLLMACVWPAAAAADSPPTATVVVSVKPWSYSPSPLHVPAGSTVTFVNVDPFSGEGHSISDVAIARGERGRFSSAVVPQGEQGQVLGVQTLARGTYPFTCMVHPFMSGTLVVD